MIAIFSDRVLDVWPHHRLVAVVISYLVCGGIVALIQLVGAARRVFTAQSTTITSLREIVDSKDDEYTRDTSRRNDAHAQKIRELSTTIERLSTEQAPDVALEWSEDSGGLFALRAAEADALEVRIDPPLSTGSYTSNWKQIGDTSVPIITAAVEASFPVVDVYKDERVPVKPFVNYALGSTFALPSFMAFIEAAMKRRSTEEPKPTPDEEGHISIDALDEYSRRINRPYDFDIRITYWNRSKTRQWERVEVLHSDPVLRRSHVIHGVPRLINSR